MSRGVDIVVAGARVAGSLTAILAARAGLRVLVLEPHRFPSDTLSTHFFRGGGLGAALDRIGVLPRVLDTGAPPLRTQWFDAEGSAPEEGGPQDPGELGYALCVRRVTLDAILADQAIADGVDIRWGRRIVEVLRDGDRVIGVIDDTGDTHLAGMVVGADGRRSSVAQLVGAAEEIRYPAARAMYFRYATGWRDLGAEPAPEFSLLGNELAYAFPCDGGIACLSVSVTAAAHEAAAADHAGYAMDRLAAHHNLTDRLEEVTWTGKMRIAQPHDSVVRQASGPGWALVGDAGAVQDPYAGLGMDTAARQAQALVDVLTERPDDWWTAYPQARDAVTLDGFRTTSRHAPDLRTLLAG